MRKNILPTNLEDPNLRYIYETDIKLVCKLNVKEIHKESSKNIPNKEC